LIYGISATHVQQICSARASHNVTDRQRLSRLTIRI
jgi:hypothetical protein